MAAIGGNTPKFLQVTTPQEGTSASVRIDVINPHLVGIGEVVVEIQDGKLHVTSSLPGTSDLVIDSRDPE